MQNILFFFRKHGIYAMLELKIMFNKRGYWQFLPILKGGVSLPKLYEMRVAYCFVDRHGMSWLEPTFSFLNRPLLDALYKMVVWCIENGYIKTI